MNIARGIKTSLLTLSVSGLAVGLVACQGPTTSDIDGTTMGNAEPVVSPAATDPAGDVIELDSAYSNVEDMEKAGDHIALRSGSTLAIGSIDDFRENAPTRSEIDAACGDLTATPDEFVLACPDGVHIFSASSGQETEIVATSAPVSTATKTSDGTIIAGVTDENRALRLSGGEEKDFSTEYDSTEMVSVPVDGREDAVLRTNSRLTIIQDLKWADANAGAILRVGKGVGQLAPAEHGMALATDNIGSQLMVYLADDVVRLQKTIPVDESPWGVTYDSQNRQAWVTSTADNQLVAWDIAAPSMKEVERFNTVANALNVVVLDSGAKVVASATGDGLQVID